MTYQRTEPCLTQLTWWRQQSGYLETALKQVFACDDVRDLSLVQAVGNGHGSESGVQSHDCQSQSRSVSCVLLQVQKLSEYTSYICLSLTWKIVHEAGLCCNEPLGSGLTEDGDVTLRLLAESRQTAAKTLGCVVSFLVGQPVIVP